MPYGVGFLKNKYVGRSFIAPSQDMRETAVRIKLNVIRETIQGKRVVLIDDSIVRGTTSERIVRLLREEGALEVHMRISSPPFRYPCFFGTDVDSAAHRLTGKNCPFCDGCFTGRYPISIPEDQGKSKFERPIAEEESDEEKCDNPMR